MTPEVTPPSAANPYDLIVLGVFFFSAAMGIYRGLTKEVLSIAAWVGAGLTATFCYLPFRDMFRGFISYVFIADIANILVVFVTSLVIMTMLISTVSEKIKHSRLGGLDRSLGCLFGATRAFLMLEAIFLLSFMIWKKPEDRAHALPVTVLFLPILKNSLSRKPCVLPTKWSKHSQSPNLRKLKNLKANTTLHPLTAKEASKT
jgi:membrane protein required for colicin V production